MDLTIEEYNDLVSLLNAFGYICYYTGYPEYQGLQVIRDLKAIQEGLIVSDEVKQKVYQVLKENSDPRLWKH